MQTNNNDHQDDSAELFYYDQNKIVLSVRISPVLKQKLSDQADALGITLSEHAENQLHNFDAKSNEVKQLSATLNAKEREISRLQHELKDAQARPKILNDPRLLSIYEQVKGMSDEIITPDGTKHPTTYATPEHLLYAMIYSFTLNN